MQAQSSAGDLCGFTFVRGSDWVKSHTKLIEVQELEGSVDPNNSHVYKEVVKTFNEKTSKAPRKLWVIVQGRAV
jgi:hypothetical protein